MLPSKVTSKSHGEDSSYFLGLQEYEKNPYDPIHNPNGIIQMGVAENQLSLDLLENWLEKNQEALLLKRNGTESIFRQLALFQDYHGLPRLKNEMVKFMSKLRGNKVTFDPNNLILTAGSTSANETLMFCLAEPGDAFLLPTPYYPGFDRDLKWRTGVEIVPIRCYSANGFRITPSALEEAHKRAKKQGLRVKGVLITNPSNPLGTTMRRDELNHLIDFALANSLHIVSDEVYSATVFTSPDFLSITEAVKDRNLKDTKLLDRVHVVYSVSKDLGLPGFRVGLIYSNNRAVVSAATKMSSFGLVSSQTQHLLACILGDAEFTERQVAESRRRLRERREGFESGLREAGVGWLEGNAGLFCWVDMRKLMWGESFEAEKEVWVRMVREVGVNVTPGASCHCSEPGWFRMCFTNMSEETMRVGVKRVKEFVESRDGVRSRLLSLAKCVLPYCSSDRQVSTDR